MDNPELTHPGLTVEQFSVLQHCSLLHPAHYDGTPYSAIAISHQAIPKIIERGLSVYDAWDEACCNLAAEKEMEDDRQLCEEQIACLRAEWEERNAGKSEDEIDDEPFEVCGGAI